MTRTSHLAGLSRRTGEETMNTMNMNLMMICVLLLPSLSFGSYRDKHGNEGTITLGSPVVGSAGSGIDYTVPYTLTDSEGDKSGHYTITSQMLPGRDAPTSDDFVLSVFVSDDASQNAAELIFRNNCNESPIAPILRRASYCRRRESGITQAGTGLHRGWKNQRRSRRQDRDDQRKRICIPG